VREGRLGRCPGDRTLWPMMIPVAHAGHWLEGALYLAPVLILVVVLFVQGRRPDRELADEDV
jgi:hypothetical protein